MTFPPPIDTQAADAAERRQACLTKPPGSLGRLEELAVRLAAFQGTPIPRVRPAAALLFAADHPVTRHGVSPYPSAVTQAMVRNFLTGGAAVSVLARRQSIPLHVVDVGVDGSTEALPDPAPGTSYRRDRCAESPAGDLRVEDAMPPETFAACKEAGRAAVHELPSDTRLVVLGEMGIGNTTAAAAICGALLDGEPESFVGAGTGADEEMLDRKRAVVRDAVNRLAGLRDPDEVVRRVGGREIAALLGAMEAAVALRRVVLVDGFIVTAAALALLKRVPEARHGLLFAHRSDEQAHARVLAWLGVEPLLDLGLRLGEASGALVAFPLVELACALHAEMATFESAAVPDRTDGP